MKCYKQRRCHNQMSAPHYCKLGKGHKGKHRYGEWLNKVLTALESTT